MKQLFWKIFIAIDRRLKFPMLNKGEIGIQLGFDMSAPVTSDLFLMAKCVGPTGKVIGIDPDSSNLAIAQKIIEQQHLPIQLIHKAVYSETGTMQLLLGEQASWNQLNNIAIDETVSFSGSVVEVAMDTLDNILKETAVPIEQIGHVNITINGAEYGDLLGMQQLLSTGTNLGITVIAGRYDQSGIINGIQDYKLIKQLLLTHGFKVKFRRIHKLFWWGFVVNTLMKRKWIYGKKNYGVIMAAKGNKTIPWYQSFS